MEPSFVSILSLDRKTRNTQGLIFAGTYQTVPIDHVLPSEKIVVVRLRSDSKSRKYATTKHASRPVSSNREPHYPNLGSKSLLCRLCGHWSDMVALEGATGCRCGASTLTSDLTVGAAVDLHRKQRSTTHCEPVRSCRTLRDATL